jgi:cell division protein FtsQ
MVRKGEKNIFKLLKWVLIILVAVLIFILARKFAFQQSSNSCADLIIEINQVNGIKYIDEEGVKKFVLEHNETIIGQMLSQINLDSIEKSLQAYPFVRNAEAYTDLDSRVHIQIDQMMPILRVHPNGQKPYYLSKEGKSTPLSKIYTAHVVVANGYISKSMSNKLYTLMRYVNESKLWNAQIEQIFVTSEQEITLIPKLGKFSIILGDIDQLDSKFSKLETFFREGLNKTGWDKYKSIDLKYNKLIICK